MVVTNTSTTTNLPTHLRVWRWNSPTPYLLGAIIVVLGLIALALLMLVCSYRKRSDEPHLSAFDGEHIGREVPVISANTELDTKPKVVVIMAGDDVPTFYAAPSQIHTQVSSFNRICTCDDQV